MTGIFLIIGLIYFGTIGILIVGNLKLQDYNSLTGGITLHDGKTRFSILVPFRNEVELLPHLVRSIQKLEYPSHLYEVIFIDDQSEDASVGVLKDAIISSQLNNLRIISTQRKSKSPKKDAITTAIEIAKYEWVLTTDADCQLPIKWLQVYDGYIRKNRPKFIVGPVLIESNHSFLINYQQLDGLSLQGVTMGSFGINNPILCNGANLGYLKTTFVELEGFAGNDHIASGDDIFMLEKMKRTFPQKLSYVKSKNAIVLTRSVNTWRKCIDQRIRWASKTSRQKSAISSLIGMVVFMTSILTLIGGLMCLFLPELWRFYVSFVFSKLLIDYIFLRLQGSFFGIQLQLNYFFLSFLVYPWITTWVVIGSLRGNYSWKGRLHKNF